VLKLRYCKVVINLASREDADNLIAKYIIKLEEDKSLTRKDKKE
jgi:hypothetical protein